MTVKKTQKELGAALDNTEHALGGLENALDKNGEANVESNGLPEGWHLVSIDDVTFKGEQRKPEDSEELIYVDIGSIDRNKKIISTPQQLLGKDAPSRARRIISKGDVLVSLTRPNLNAVALVPEKYDRQFASTGFEVLKPVGYDSRLLFSITKSKSFIDSISGTVQGALYPAAKSADVKSYEIPLPPRAEQTVIAQTLDTLLAQVDNIKTRLDAIPKILKIFRQSVLAAAVSGKLTEEWRGENECEDIRTLIDRNTAKKDGKLKVRKKSGWDQDLDLARLPSGWDWIENHKLAIDSNTAICAGPFGTIFKAKDFRDSGVPIIFLRHVKEGGFNQRKPNYMDAGVWKENHQEYSVYGGELLVAKLGEPPGESCIFPSDFGTAMVTPDVLKMNVDSEVADIKYLMSFFNSPISKKMIGDAAFGATRLRIDIALFKCFPIPLPPREEQTQIIQRLEEFFAFADQVEQQVKNAQGRVNNLTQSILAKAFRGELTTQWRSEHPELISGENSAEALLDKIKIEREILNNQTKSKRKSVKKKTGSSMTQKIIKVVEALQQAGKPLNGQQLLAAAGYPSDSDTADLEQFFLDIREALINKKSIVKLERSDDSQDWFTLAETKSKS
jgi:type I restriction enzyme S subunit